MARQGENIYLRKDGRYEGRFIKGHKPNGRPIYGSVYARGHQECREKLNHAKAIFIKQNSVLKVCGTGLVSEFMAFWLNNIVKQSVKISTFGNYLANLDNWINPLLGNMEMRRIDRGDVQQFVDTLVAENLSVGTVQNICRVLFSAMKKAVKYGYLHRNPCEGIHLPEMPQKKTHLLTMAEQRQVEKAAEKDANGLPVLLAMYTGLRIGELCALRWCDVDLENGIIHISETRQRAKSFSEGAKTVLVTGTPKGPRADRCIPLSVSMSRLLLAHGEKSNGKNEYVFTYREKPIEPRLLQYRLKTMLKKAGIQDVNFHTLQHSFATRSLALCFEINGLRNILGHGLTDFTLGEYSYHRRFKQEPSAMLSFDRLYDMSEE